jgi:glutamate/tyrosine decarboxylase-like PLP-dependent enzyme
MLDPTPELFPSSGERVKLDDYLTLALRDVRTRIPARRVSPQFDAECFRSRLKGFDFQTPLPLRELLPWVIEQLEQGIVHLTHPRYFGLFNPNPTFASECADRIVAALNPQLATSTTSPVPVELEAHVIRAVAARVGFPARAMGHFTTGGSEANATALTCALTRANPAVGRDGVAAFSGRPVIYVSAEAHLAWHKIAHQAGIGRSAVRLIDVDDDGRMREASLTDAVTADIAQGNAPVMVVATAGTTGAGEVDPLAACAQFARAHRLWYHVDAAWGGGLIASDRLCGALSGIEDADSVTIDAHKWFATTMGCGMFIARDPAILSDCFHASTTYMPSNEAGIDPYVTTQQWSRRFLGLRLFLSLAVAGWRGYGAHIERSVQLAALLKAELQARGWSIVNHSPMAVVCAEPPFGSASPREIARQIVASGTAWISTTVFRGRDVVRMCITNGQTTPDDIYALVTMLGAFTCNSVTARSYTTLG